ncbi:MAG TPA: Ig-like domain-containing protein, partial [Terriglobales bacterium]|nr:Ig-like domain-containing protein [Terriglobales bacterium]
NTHIGSAPLNGGVAVFSTAKLAVGGHTIKAYYTPDAASASLVSSETTTMVTITQGMAASNTVMTVDAHLALSPSTLTATVTSASGTPTGTVDFSDGSTALGSVTLNSSGVATYTAPFTGGSHTFTATYSGDASFSPSGAAATATIPREYSTTSLSIAAGANAFSPTTFTATVTTTVGTPTGSVTFRDGATELGTATLSNGVATLSVNVSGGDHINVAAVYGGDTNVEGSSGSASVTIAKATSNTSLSITAGASAFSPSTLTATVSAAVGVPSGTVTFKDGVTTLGSAPVSTGIATLAMNLSAGVHSNVTAVYGGDSDFDGSSGAASVTIPLLPSSTSLALSPNPTAGGKLTLTATVSASVAPAGTVTFRDGATVINTVNVSNGAATLDIFGLVAGSYSFTASFSGAGFSDSSSTAQNLTVAQDFAPPAPASNALTVSPGGTATLALNIAPEPGGFTSTVTLACSGAPTGATCSISPSTVTPGSNGASATLTLTTTGNSAALHSSPRAPLFALWLPLAGIGLCGAGFGRKRRWALLAVIALLALPVMIACGGGGSSSASTTPSTPTTPTTQGSTTPSGTYALTVTATSGSIQHSTVINLTVK